MMRKVISLAMFLMGILCVQAQQPQPQPTPLPLDPKIKAGVLSNGLHYYILHNEEPKGRANFYIAQKVGSTLETQEQLGLAHFLEHMAFNGTKNFPGKNLLNYLQSKGIRFGADINAYTGFDETVYNINNVPTADMALMDSVLLALHDWSCAIALEDAEIDAERGVIREEWRMRRDAQNRYQEKALKDIYEEYQYQQMPIGDMEIVANFKYDVLRDYYHNWYRPDQQGIVVVGDFDADVMEQKVKELFSKIEMPKNAPKREYASVSNNKKPIYSVFTDPELQYTSVRISFKSEKLPRELRSTLEGYLNGPLLESIISRLVNNRLSEYSNDPKCQYGTAQVWFGNFWVSSTKDAFNIFIVPKGDDIKGAVDEAMGIIARAFKTGFTFSELERVTSEMLSQYDKAFNERDKTNSDARASEIIRHFIDNDPLPGIEMEYDLVKQVLPTLPVGEINNICQHILTPDNQVIVVAQPTKDGVALMTEDIMVKSISDAMSAEYEPYVDEVITDPLIAKLPSPGKVNNITENAELGATVINLSNGVKVIVKTTDFASDQILFQAFKEGGKRSYPSDQAANVLLASDAFEFTKYGDFDSNKLRKYLAGKNVALGYSIGNVTNVLSGGCAVKDLPTLMELIYSAFTNLNPDEELYNTKISQARAFFENHDKDPETVFNQHVSAAVYGNNPIMEDVDLKTLDAANYQQMLAIIKESLANAADYTFEFVGNVDIADLRPLLEQYVATLPVARRKKVPQLSSISPVDGKIDDSFNFAASTPQVFVYNSWCGNEIPYNIENSVKISILGQILSNKYIETLREEEGGTYSPNAYAYMNPNTGYWMIVAQYQTNAEQYKKLMQRSEEELKKLLSNGADAENFNKVREATLKQYENGVRTNGYWLNSILSYERGFNTITNHRAAIENLTLDQFNAFLKTINIDKNEVQVVMNCEPVN